MDLIGKVTRELGVTREQAAAGVGALLTLAAVRLADRADQGTLLQRLADATPGFSDLLAQAPRFDARASGGFLGRTVRSIGRCCGRRSLHAGFGGSLYPLAGLFTSLGLSQASLEAFVRVVCDFLRESAGPELEEQVLRTWQDDG